MGNLVDTEISRGTDHYYFREYLRVKSPCMQDLSGIRVASQESTAAQHWGVNNYSCTDKAGDQLETFKASVGHQGRTDDPIRLMVS